MTEIEKKKVAVIVPSDESRALYHPFLSTYDHIQYFYYRTLDDFTNDAGKVGGCDGFIIDLGTIVKAKAGEKEFVNYLLDIFPSIRISHSPDKKNVIGHVCGRLLKNELLFDHYFYEQLTGNKDYNHKSIAVIVGDDENRSLYFSYFKEYPIFRFRHFFSAAELMKETEKNHRYCGIIVDLRTILKESPKDKEILNELIDSFPSIRIARSPDKQGVIGNIRDKNLQDKALFDYFLNDLCQHFLPRGIRTQKRKSLFLNVSLDFFKIKDSHAPTNKNDPIKANSVDVSEEGSFILGTMDVKKDEKLQLVITELKDQTPIKCTIKWIMPWGQSHNHLPGFGASFDSMTQNQRDQLNLLLRQRV
jgi:PilZ domain